MEYLEGETLAHRLERGPLPLNEALRYALQIADALDKAHRQGVVHRDLKPGNVVITKVGAKLLDFGLAKLWGSRDKDSGLSSVPTEAKPLTEKGAVLGTFQYMAPEQLEGKEADARADIFAFGAVLYEMVTGQKAFKGESQASLIAAILEKTPTEIGEIRPEAPAVLDRAIMTCLAKDADDRFQSAHDLGLQLSWLEESATPVAQERARPERRELLAWSLAIVSTAVALGSFVLSSRDAPSSARPVRFSFHPPGFRYGNYDIVSVSPDGEKLAFIAENEQGADPLWVRPITESVATPLAGTEGAYYPFWSPDGSAIAFERQRGLFIVPEAGGPVQTVVAAGQLPEGFGGSWSASGTILLGSHTLGLLRVDGGGGSVSSLPELGEWANWPYFLPDGQHFLYLGVMQEGQGAGASNLGIFVASLERPSERRLLVPISSRPVFTDDHLLYVRDGVLLTQPFDLDSLEPAGDTFPVADGLFYFQSHGGVPVSGGGGVLSYVVRQPARPYLWLARDGETMDTLGEPSLYGPASLSPDGGRAVVSVTSPRNGTQDLYLIDIARETSTRLTQDEASESWPVWSPDGQRIALYSDRDGPPDIYILDLASGEPEKLLWSAPGVQDPLDWSPDGSEILITDLADSEGNLWLVPVSSETEPVPLAPAVSRASTASFSPDGRWLAFESSESGRPEIYVQPFRRAGAKVRLSRAGGSYPRWRRDGRELFFQSGQSLVAVRVEAGADFSSGPPETLFTLDQRFSFQDVTSDGERFLVSVEPRPHEWQPIEVMVGWTTLLER